MDRSGFPASLGQAAAAMSAWLNPAPPWLTPMTKKNVGRAGAKEVESGAEGRRLGEALARGGTKEVRIGVLR